MAIKKEGNLYIVDSSRDKSKKYKVDPKAPSCSCAHFLFRLKRSGGECKHIKQVKESLADEKSVPDDVKEKVLEDIRNGKDDVIRLIEEYGDDCIDSLIESGEAYEEGGRLHILE